MYDNAQQNNAVFELFTYGPTLVVQLSSGNGGDSHCIEALYSPCLDIQDNNVQLIMKYSVFPPVCLIIVHSLKPSPFLLALSFKSCSCLLKILSSIHYSCFLPQVLCKGCTLISADFLFE